MGSATNFGARWTDAEDAVLREHYATDGVNGVCALLPHRPKAGIYHRANKLGLHAVRPWTAAEDSLLEERRGVVHVTTLAKHLNRTPYAIYERRRLLGLNGGVPQGCTTLPRLERVCGYSRPALVKILRAHEVWMRKLGSRSEKRARHEHIYVDEGEAMIAIAAHECRVANTTNADALALRYGVSVHTMRAALDRAGLFRQEHQRGTRWMVPTVLAELAIAPHLASWRASTEWRERRSVATHRAWVARRQEAA